MRSVSTYPAGTGTRRPPGLPSISSSSSELSGVGLGTPILRRRLWGGSGGRRGLWGTRAAGGTCPGGGQKAEQRSVGAQSPDEREPPTPRPPLLFSSSRRSSRPPQLRDHSRRAPPPGHAHMPAPPPPRPWPRNGQTSTLMVAPPLAAGWASWRHLGSSIPTRPRSERTPPCTCQPFRENRCLQGPWG